MPTPAALDLRIKGKFKVDFAAKPSRYTAQYFWPDVKPWPRGVIQQCVEGEIHEQYYIFINFETHTILPGSLVLMDDLENPRMMVYPQQLREEHYLIKEVQE